MNENRYAYSSASFMHCAKRQSPIRKYRLFANRPRPIALGQVLVDR